MGKQNTIDRSVLAASVRPLLDWYNEHKRDLPWRGTRDPYRVWLSEIMLQQTRVEAVKGYYERFVRELPDVFALSRVEDDRLNKLWEGLGYYSRARNLKRTACAVVERYGGIFPSTREELRRLSGIGDYTAGAIASIAFGLPEAAVDGNVLRVLGRVLREDTPIDDLAYRKRLTEALSSVYPAGECAAFTQSFMDLGSAVCTPKNPLCGACPLAGLCGAFATGTVDRYPVRKQKRQRRIEQKTVFVLYRDGCLAVEKREANGLLGGLWQLPNVEGHLDNAAADAKLREWGLCACHAFTVTRARHVFTHIEWDMTVFTLDVEGNCDRFTWATPARLNADISLPTAFKKTLPHA